MKISNNFTMAEMIASDTANRLKIENIPDTKELETIAYLVKHVLQPIRDKWGGAIKVNSGYRCKKLNAAVKGAANSAHIYGAAADITTGSKQKNKQLFNLITCMMDMGQMEDIRTLIEEKNYSWLHIDINAYGLSYRKHKILHI